MHKLNGGAWRNDAYAKVTGTARFTDDLKFPEMLHAVPVYCNFVHARIKKVRTEKAEQTLGVVRIITAKDVTGSTRYGQIIKDYRIIADDKIRYWGDVVAVVVAETREQAIAAAKLVTVDAEELPSVFDPEEALKENAPLIHEENGTNVIYEHRIRRGDIEKGFGESDFVIEHQFQTQFVEHAYLEAETAVCVPRGDGTIAIYGSMQHPFSTRRFTAALTGMKLADLEVIGMPMGGGFGGKDDTAAAVCARAALAAKLIGRPVKMTYEREWSIRESYKRHPYRMYYKMGVGKDGFIKAVSCKIIADGGAYCSTTPWVTWRSTVQCCGPYVVPNVHCDMIGVYTNNVFTGAMRGFGSPQVNFAIEQLIEIAAKKAGISEIEFRKRNMVKQGSVTITGQILDDHKVAMGEVLDKVLQDIQYVEKRKLCSYGQREKDELYGIGIAMSYRGMSLGAEGVDFCAAIINVQADGSILLEVGVHENGQGSESTMVLALAEELKVKRERITYRLPSTSTIPDSGTTVASRGTIVGTGAVVAAANELKKKMASVIAPLLDCAPDEVKFKDEQLFGRNPQKSISFEDAVKKMFLSQEFPYAFGVFKAPRVSWDEHIGQGKAYFTWVYGCQAVELTVNRKTGKVRILNQIAAHDVGKAVNRDGVLGQFYGGMAMGTGYALFEEVKMEEGRIKNLNYNTYRIPRATDLPEMTAIIIENTDPNSASGAKGVGEPTNEIMAPAIANAIYNATGLRYFTLPIKIKKS